MAEFGGLRVTRCESWRTLSVDANLAHRGADFYVTCFASSIDSAEDVLATLRVQDVYGQSLLAKDFFTDGFVAPAADIKQAANCLLEGHGLGLRKKRIQSSAVKGWLVALVNNAGESVLAERLRLAKPEACSAEERLRRSTIEWEMTDLEGLVGIASAGENRGKFYLTCFQAVDPYECRKRVVTARFPFTFGACAMCEAESLREAVQLFGGEVGHGLRDTTPRAADRPGCLVLMFRPKGPADTVDQPHAPAAAVPADAVLEAPPVAEARHPKAARAAEASALAVVGARKEQEEPEPQHDGTGSLGRAFVKGALAPEIAQSCQLVERHTEQLRRLSHEWSACSAAQRQHAAARLALSAAGAVAAERPVKIARLARRAAACLEAPRPEVGGGSRGRSSRRKRTEGEEQPTVRKTLITALGYLHLTDAGTRIQLAAVVMHLATLFAAYGRTSGSLDTASGRKAWGRIYRLVRLAIPDGAEGRSPSFHWCGLSAAAPSDSVAVPSSAGSGSARGSVVRSAAAAGAGRKRAKTEDV